MQRHTNTTKLHGQLCRNFKKSWYHFHVFLISPLVVICCSKHDSCIQWKDWNQFIYWRQWYVIIMYTEILKQNVLATNWNIRNFFHLCHGIKAFGFFIWKITGIVFSSWTSDFWILKVNNNWRQNICTA